MPATAKHPSLQPADATKNDFLPLNGTDYVEFYVGTRDKPHTFIAPPSG